MSRAQAVGAAPDPSALAAAICPEGPAALAQDYAPGSFLNGLSSWWGKNHPDRSGFATREQWARDEPSNADVQRLWGLALLRNARVAEAAQVLTKVVGMEPNVAEAHAGLGQAMLAGGQYTDAATEFISALKLDPKSVPALIGLGYSSIRAGLKYARPALLKATQLAPSSADAWIGLGQADYGHDEYTVECIHAFKTGAALAPARADYFDDYAEALRKNGQTADAQSLLMSAIQRTPDDAKARYLLGYLILQTNPTPTALNEAETMTRASINIGRTALADRQLGDILIREGRVSEAVAQLKQAIVDDPYQVEARRILARAYGQLGQPALAATLSKRADELFDAQQLIDVLVNQSDQRFLDPAYHQELAALYQQTGQFALAQQETQRRNIILANPAAAAKSNADLQSFVKSLGG